MTVVNAGVSGNTAADGLARLDTDVPEGTDGVVLELGANDKLRRRDPMAAQAALSEIVRRLQARGIPVLIAGIRFTDAAGTPYNSVFSSIAKRFGTIYYPDIYSGLAADRRLTIFDGVHPSPQGVTVMVSGILSTAERFVRGLAEAKVRSRPQRSAGSVTTSHRRYALSVFRKCLFRHVDSQYPKFYAVNGTNCDLASKPVA